MNRSILPLLKLNVLFMGEGTKVVSDSQGNLTVCVRNETEIEGKFLLEKNRYLIKTVDRPQWFFGEVKGS